MQPSPIKPSMTTYPHLQPHSHIYKLILHIFQKTGTKQLYLLVIVDQFSKWPEAFVTQREDAKTVAKILATEIIPRFGCPLQINSDNGPAFISKITHELVEWLQINWNFHIPYHPQSSGIVERMNRNIKEKLLKATAGTWVKWQNYLPAILAEIRMTPNRTTRLSPFEVLMGRPFPTPWVKAPLIIKNGDLDCIKEQYVKQLIDKLNGIYGDVSSRLPLPSQEPTHPFKPGDMVCIRQLNKAKEGGFPFSKPVTVIAVTRTAVLTDDKDIWIHASREKLCPKRGEAGDKLSVTPHKGEVGDKVSITPHKDQDDDLNHGSKTFLQDLPFPNGDNVICVYPNSIYNGMLLPT
ncbi:uncharacterized protein LOC128635892 [Bombina bombina]|uniref:uncharacterized protein LOC128635892 n=1 Tax=Bombina bombina TaxID=8345 RepID=UPI00235A9F77|nr:uncharacterized protein LOC128635892 [Bombina bombina]